MLLTTQQMKAAEAAAFKRGIQEEELMEAAGEAIAEIVRQFHPRPGRVIAFGGKGNNAGDVLVAARILSCWGWNAEFCGAYPETDLGKLPSQKLKEFRQVCCTPSPHSKFPLVALDGLLGVGASGPPRAEICVAIDRICQLQREQGAWTLAADIPTGLDADSGQPYTPCVQADLTATIGFVKEGLLADAATRCVGRLALIPLPQLVSNEGDPAELVTPHLLHPWFPPRSFDSHKGTYGRVGILAGSRNFPGAARLCTHAALRAGAGIVILFATEELHALLIAASLPPETIVFPIQSFHEVLHQRLDSLCIGPGLGSERSGEILDVVRDAEVPMVVDADALNAIAKHPQIFQECQAPRLLTPHPGEFARLAPELAQLPRRKAAETFVSNKVITLLLKGARTIVAEKGSPSLFNSTGNPGMGSGGMGDTLTGVCGALLAQGLTPRQAASAGAWLCGRAAEIAVFSHRQSPESLLAGDVTELLGQAFGTLRENAY